MQSRAPQGIPPLRLRSGQALAQETRKDGAPWLDSDRVNSDDGQKGNQFSEVDGEFLILDLWCGWRAADWVVGTLRMENFLGLQAELDSGSK